MTYRAPESKKKKNRMLPIIGIALGVLFAIIAYVLTPTVIQVLSLPLFIDVNDPFPLQGDHFIVTVMTWIVMFTIVMALVAMLVGSDPEEKAGIQIRKDFEKRKKERAKRKR